MNQNLIRLLNLRKRLREQIRTSGGVPPAILALIHDVEEATDKVIHETYTNGAEPPQ